MSAKGQNKGIDVQSNRDIFSTRSTSLLVIGLLGVSLSNSMAAVEAMGY